MNAGYGGLNLDCNGLRGILLFCALPASRPVRLVLYIILSAHQLAINATSNHVDPLFSGGGTPYLHEKSWDTGQIVN